MNKFLLLLFGIFTTSLLMAQPTEKRICFYKNTQTLKEDYSVLSSDTTIKHGEYIYYFINQKTRLQGQYAHGEKDGKWAHFNDKGQYKTIQYFTKGQPTGIWLDYTNREVIQRYDHDKREVLPPILPEVYINYPALGRENEIEGMVMMKFLLDENCDITEAVPIKTLGPDFEQAVIEGFRVRHALMKKYKVEIEGCAVGEQIFSVNFTLN